MEEIGAAVQIIELSADVTFKTIGLTQDMIEMLVNLIQYMRNQQLMQGGNTALENLIKKDGSLHVFQFPENEKDRVIDALEKYKVSYCPAMDLNVHDGKSEVFVSGADLDRVSLVAEKLKLGEVKDTAAWMQEADPEMKEFFSNVAETEVPETARAVDGKENTAFVRFPVPMESGSEDLNTERGVSEEKTTFSKVVKKSEKVPVINFSINKDSIYEGAKDGCHVIRIPGTWKKDGGPYHVHIPEQYARTAVVDNQKTLLLRLPNNVKCRVTNEQGQEEWHSPQDIHKMGFAEADKKVKQYAEQKKKKRTQEKMRQKAYQQQKRKYRY